MKLLMLAASLRKDSYNKQLIRIAEKLSKELGAFTTLVEFNDFISPMYNADDETSIGFPEPIKKFEQLIKSHDALVISSPEYNFTTPGTLKNFIDWLSRLNPTPLKNLPILLMSASPSMVGGNRGLWNTRIPLEYCNAFVYPSMFSLSTANNMLDEHGQLKDENLVKRLKQNIADFIPYAKALSPIK